MSNFNLAKWGCMWIYHILLEIWGDATNNLVALWMVDGLKYGFVWKRWGKTRTYDEISWNLMVGKVLSSQWFCSYLNMFLWMALNFKFVIRQAFSWSSQYLLGTDLPGFLCYTYRGMRKNVTPSRCCCSAYIITLPSAEKELAWWIGTDWFQ